MSGLISANYTETKLTFVSYGTPHTALFRPAQTTPNSAQIRDK